ncbi:MAG: hypothetical protein AUJ82_02290 [Verrucomicrobia bacterium CG1_02_43_26]|nr:MAG: hypothetical protein AUJ82_02290 [Verrucomicrobia bacterium CG1_02_43_26]
MILDFIAQLFLVSVKLIASALVIGYLCGNKEYLVRTLFIFAFTMILNPYLKYLFQIQEYPGATGYGWVFPSGHMQASFAFWGWLAVEYRNRFFSCFVIILLTGVAWGLIYFGYHTLLDVLGAISAGLITFVGYDRLRKIKLFQKHVYLLGYLLLLVSIPLILTYPQKLYVIRSQIWIGVGLLLAFPIAFLIQSRNEMNFSFYQKVYVVALAVLGVLLINVGVQWIHGAAPSFSMPVLVTIQYVLTALWVGAGVSLLFALLLKKWIQFKKVKTVQAHG